MVSALFLPLGLLGLAQVTRWSGRRLTLVATPLFLWGMWGFHNVLSDGLRQRDGGALAGPARARPRPLNEGLVTDPGAVWLALVPHLVGSFFGVLLLTVAAWRSGRVPRAACALVMAFLVWDFFLPPVGSARGAPAARSLGWGWLGVTLVRMPQAVWTGATR